MEADDMNEDKTKGGVIKRHLGRAVVDVQDGRATGAMMDGLANAGYEVVTRPSFDKDGRFQGETMEIYEVIKR